MLEIVLAARRRALEREHRERAWLAWHIAALGRAKTMPPLKRLIEGRAKPQTPGQMAASFAAWAAIGDGKGG